MTQQDKINMLTALFEIFPLFHHWFANSSISEEFGITKTQEIILMSLMNNPSLTMSNLAHSIHSSKEHATRSVNTLVELQLIERCADQKNRRLVLVKLTEKGRTYIEERKAALTSNLVEKFSLIPEEELNRFHRAVYDIHEILFKINLTEKPKSRKNEFL